MVHVVILAGARKKSYIKGEPKCFKDMPTGESIVEEILHEISGIKRIQEIVIVGPEEGLRKLRKRKLNRFKKRIFLVKQGKNQQENLTLAKQELVKRLKLPKKDAEKLGFLILFGDTPFRMRCSVEEFIDQIEGKDLDLALHFVHEDTLERYYRLSPKPLIPLSVGGVPGNYKETNMAYFNPDKFIGDLMTRFYGLRHTSRLRSMIELRKLIRSVAGKEVYAILERGFFVRTWHRTLCRIAPRWLHTPKILYRKLEKDKLVALVHQRFGIKLEMFFSSFPDGYLDVDNRADYLRIYRRYFELRKAIQRDCRCILKKKPQ